jgi:putative hydrolase
VHPIDALRRTAFLLEREQAPTYRVAAFRTAALAVAGLGEERLRERAEAGTLTELAGIGPKTAGVVTEALAGRVPEYLQRLEDAATDLTELDDAARALLGSLRGDLHAHSDWSDGGSPVEEMAATALEVGHEYLAITDHSPRLGVANGLRPERLERQIALVQALDGQLGEGFRLLTGIEVDILGEGELDQTPDLLARLDVVVASVHSGLGGKQSPQTMTQRLLGAVANPDVDVLGHCTGRLVRPREQGGGRSQRPRPEAPFDAEEVFAACAAHGVAVEVNSRPERLDPPRRLLRRAVEAGCLLSIDSDAHAPGQLAFLEHGAARAAECGADPDRVVTTWPVERLLAWTADHSSEARGA